MSSWTEEQILEAYYDGQLGQEFDLGEDYGRYTTIQKLTSKESRERISKIIDSHLHNEPIEISLLTKSITNAIMQEIKTHE